MSHCEQCWVERRPFIPAALHIDERDLCLPCIADEGLDPADGTPLAPPIVRVPTVPIAPQRAPRARTPRPKRERVAKVKAPKPPKPPREPKPRISKRAEYAPRVCVTEGCGIVFQPLRRDQIAHSKECGQLHWHRLHRRSKAKHREPRICAWHKCGKEFTPRCDRGIHCSLACCKAHDLYRRRRRRGPADRQLRGMAKKWWMSLDGAKRVQVMEAIQAGA